MDLEREDKTINTLDCFTLERKVAVVTGGAGFLGEYHAHALLSAGACVVLADIDGKRAQARSALLSKQYPRRVMGAAADVGSAASVMSLRRAVLKRFGRIDILVNNAAVDAKVKGAGLARTGRLETFSLAQWNQEVRVGLTGAFLCAQSFGTHMAAHGGGVILNIASDLAVIAPDQRLYRKPGLAPHRQPVKPVTYSVIKTALVGLTRYLSTYWADKNVRVNALSPGGVYNGQPRVFVRRLCRQIPLGRMAGKDEYQGAVVFLCSEASRYMTGQNMVVNGGRSVW